MSGSVFDAARQQWRTAVFRGMDIDTSKPVPPPSYYLDWPDEQVARVRRHNRWWRLRLHGAAYRVLSKMASALLRLVRAEQAAATRRITTSLVLADCVLRGPFPDFTGDAGPDEDDQDDQDADGGNSSVTVIRMESPRWDITPENWGRLGGAS